MAYSFNLWTNPHNAQDVRIYINGTHRKAVYFTRSQQDGRLIWSSKTNDTPAKYRSGDHYGKVNKDRVAAHEVAEAFGLELGAQDWDRAVAIAAGGVQVEG